jgi:hypothetical protein
MTKTKTIPVSLVPASPSSDSVSSVLSVVKSSASGLALDGEERAERIAAYDAGTRRAFQHQMAFVYLAGAELLAVKEELPHGQFMKWCEQHLAQRSISYPTANRYMHVAEALQTKFLAAKKIELPQLTLTSSGGDIPESALSIISEAVREVIDGKSLNDLYRELGHVKQLQKQKHSPVRLTPEQAEADRKANAVLFLDNLAATLATFDADPRLHADLPTPKLKELHDAILTTSRKLRDLLKSRKQKPAKAAKSHESKRQQQRAKLAERAQAKWAKQAEKGSK